MKWLLVLNMAFLIACQTKQGHNRPNEEQARIDSVLQWKKDSIGKIAQERISEAKMDSIAAIVKTKPVWGVRKSLTGDFDGDGTQDTLYEKYISQLTGKETNKSYEFEGLGEGSDYLFYWQEWISEKRVLLKLVSKKPAIKPFVVDKGGLQDGFLYLKNVGDLNRDSTDEVAFILNNVDFSNSNTGYLATYKNEKWKVIADWTVTEIDFQFDPSKVERPNPEYVFKKPDGSVYLKEFDGNKLGDINWKRLKINW